MCSCISVARLPRLSVAGALQVSEAELEAIARGGGDDVNLADGAGGATTRRLLGDYATPARYFVLMAFHSKSEHYAPCMQSRVHSSVTPISMAARRNRRP